MLIHRSPVYRFLLLLLLLLTGIFAIPQVHAQISMTLTANQKKYLIYEPIELVLKMRNYTGNTLIFGKNAGALTFQLKTRNGIRTQEVTPADNPLQDMTFAPGETKQLILQLNQIFDMQKPDFYNIRACIEHKRLRNAYASNELSIEIKDGSPLLSQEIGVPSTDPSAPIRTVMARLLRFNDGKEDIYCLRIEDDKQVFGTFRIGPYISASEPQMDADSTSSIHLLVQLRPRLYAYTIYSVIGGPAKLRQLRYYVPNGGTPTLSHVSGFLRLLNARPAIEGVDYQVNK